MKKRKSFRLVPRSKMETLRRLVAAFARKHPFQVIPEEVPVEYWKDANFALVALDRCGADVLGLLPRSLLADPGFLRRLGLRSEIGVQKIAEFLPLSRDIVRALLPSDKTLFGDVPENLRSDPLVARYGPREFMRGCDRWQLEEAGKGCRNREEVLDLLCCHGDALQHVAAEHQDDIELVVAAICSHNSHLAYEFASERLRQDPAMGK